MNGDGGIIENNNKDGIVDINSDKAVVNNNYGTVGANEAGGTVSTNFGTVTTNKKDARIITNEQGGQIDVNEGSVSTNIGNINLNGEDGNVDDNFGVITINAGQVNNNKVSGDRCGSIVDNTGKVNQNFTGAIVVKNSKSGEITSNEGEVDRNEGRIINNSGVVLSNNATVVRNMSGGIVLNYSGGTVDRNDGDVYNFGGTIANSYGTEYFSVDFKYNEETSTLLPQDSADELEMLKDAYETRWIGQYEGIQNTVTVTIRPAQGYEIKEITGYDENYVEAQVQKDGTWVLTIKSGMNLSIVIPDPTKSEIYIVPDPDPRYNSEPVPVDPNAAPAPVVIPVSKRTPVPNSEINYSLIGDMLLNAIWDGNVIHLVDGSIVTVDEITTNDCATVKTELLTSSELQLIYQLQFHSSMFKGASLTDARNAALAAAQTIAKNLESDIPDNYTSDQVAMYREAYVAAYTEAIKDGKTLKKARAAARSAGLNVINKALLDQLNKNMNKDAIVVPENPGTAAPGIPTIEMPYTF